jgi:predicted transposase/invertase (TIGR01784 family)
MKGKKHNFHDSGYKKLFSSPEIVRQLLTSFVHEEWVNLIDYNTLQRIDKSFITDEFAGRESDLIYRASFKGKDLYIFIMLEFQSTVDRFMALRMLRYITELYEYLVKSYRLKTLPAVFPVMLYNGEKRWTAPVEVNKLIEHTLPERYIPSFSYYKIAENEFSREFLEGIQNSVSALFYVENSSEEDLRKEFDVLTELLRSEKPAELALFINWFRYTFNDREDIVIELKEIEEVRTMLRSSLEKYSKKLINEGIEKGILQTKTKTALALLKEKMTVEKISEITGLSVKDIEKLKK